MIYHVYANQTNIGDWLSARGIQSTLGGLPLTELFCDGPWIDATLRTIAGASPEDLVVIGGGGLLMDYFAGFWDGLAAMRPAARLVVWGVGVCDIKHETTGGPMGSIREVLSRASEVRVRDDLTRAAVGEDAAPEPMICPSVLAIGNEPATQRGVLHVDNYNAVGGGVFESMNTMCIGFAEQTGRPFARTNNRIDRGREDQMLSCLDRYRASDVVVSSGLHGCIIAAAMGRKLVAVAGDCKVDGFMEAIGLADWCLDFREAGRVGALLDRIDEQPDVSPRVHAARVLNMAFGASVRDYARPTHAS